MKIQEVSVSRKSIANDEILNVKKLVGMIIDKQDAFVSTFYAVFLSKDPSIKKLFKGTTKSQQKKLLKMFKYLAKVSDNLDECYDKLRELGAKHSKMKVQKKMYEWMLEAYHQSFESVFGDEYTNDIRLSWTKCYWIVADILQEGNKKCTIS